MTLYKAFLKIADSDYVIVSTWGTTDKSVFVASFNPKIKKQNEKAAKKIDRIEDPMHFIADMNGDYIYPICTHHSYDKPFELFFKAFPDYFWLKDVESPEFIEFKKKGKPFDPEEEARIAKELSDKKREGK